MGDMTITVGGTELGFIQAMTLSELVRTKGDPDEASWHPNNCGCCVTFHPNRDHTKGYVISSDGGYDYIDLSEEAQPD